VSTSTLPHQETIAEVLKSLETETTALFEHLDFGFLWEFPVFPPDPRGRKRVFEPPELFRGLIHCFYNDIYAPRPWSRNSQMTISGRFVGSIARHHGGRSAGSSTISPVSSKRSSPGFCKKYWSE
jgi:hypothetical protein